MKEVKERLDKVLVDRGLVSTRERARAYIMAGEVAVEGERVRKPATRVLAGSDIRILERRGGYVSRGGQKLEGALDAFRLDPSGLHCLDIGASTGGFTHCLLNRGAREVVAVDVGRNQLAYSLRKDPRVRLFEKFNARYIETLPLEKVPDLVTTDVSFISLRHILAPLRSIIGGNTAVIALVKPQFELESPRRGFKGVVTDPHEHASVLRAVCRQAGELGYSLLNLTRSPLRGPKGNIEFFFHMTFPVHQDSEQCGWARGIERVVREAHRHFNQEQ